MQPEETPETENLTKGGNILYRLEPSDRKLAYTLVIWNTLFKWETAELDYNDRTEYSVKKIARKSWKTAKKKLKIFLNIPKFSKNLQFSQYLKKYPSLVLPEKKTRRIAGSFHDQRLIIETKFPRANMNRL